MALSLSRMWSKALENEKEPQEAKWPNRQAALRRDHCNAISRRKILKNCRAEVRIQGVANERQEEGWEESTKGAKRKYTPFQEAEHRETVFFALAKRSGDLGLNWTCHFKNKGGDDTSQGCKGIWP